MEQIDTKKIKSESTKLIPTMVARPMEGLFLNKAYSCPLRLKNNPESGTGNELQVLSFFNKKCYIYDINGSGANLNRSIPFDISLLTGDPSKDIFHFHQRSKVLTLMNFKPIFVDRAYRHLPNLNLTYNFPKSRTYPSTFTQVKFDSQATKVVLIRHFPLVPVDFDEDRLDPLKKKLNMDGPSFWRMMDYKRGQNELIFRLYTAGYTTIKNTIHGRTDYDILRKQPARWCFNLTIRFNTEGAHFNPSTPNNSILLVRRGFTTKVSKKKSHLMLLGAYFGSEISFKIFYQKGRKVIKTFELNLDELFWCIVHAKSRHPLWIFDGGIGYDVKGDRLIGCDPKRFFFSIRKASEWG